MSLSLSGSFILSDFVGCARYCEWERSKQQATLLRLLWRVTPCYHWVKSTRYHSNKFTQIIKHFCCCLSGSAWKSKRLSVDNPYRALNTTMCSVWSRFVVVEHRKIPSLWLSLTSDLWQVNNSFAQRRNACMRVNFKWNLISATTSHNRIF